MATVYSPNIITNGLVLALDAANPKSYPGEGNTWYDLSGNGNHCTLYNSPAFSNGVFSLDGVDDNIQTTSTLNLTGTNAVTFIYFLQVLVYNDIKVIHELSTNFNNRSDSFVASYADDSIGQTDKIFASIKGNASYNIAVYNQSMLNDLQWHQHVVIHNTGQSSTENLIYGDGEPGPVTLNPAPGYSGNNTNNFGNQRLYIGSRAGTGYFPNMKLGQILLYNRALTQTEIQQNFNATKKRFGI